MSSPIICMVTIHGIGFEQPPSDGVQGYADDLHAHLYRSLGKLLSDDPTRQPYQSGVSVPIYLQSAFPLGSHCREDGMKRVGTWDMDHLRTINHSEAPLIKGDAKVAHIALVYSQFEGQGPQLGPAALAGEMAMSSIMQGRYANITRMLGMLFLDMEPLWAHLHLFEQHIHDQIAAPPSLRIRQDKGYRSTRLPNQPPPPNGFMAVLRQLENDVAAYVCHNDMREQIRNFVLDALLRLAYRKDVSGIVINAHSNGTVVALDVLPSLPPFAAKKIRAFITAGSPLRKYTTMFNWGQHVAMVPMTERWINFWDERDPVADPLEPCLEWSRGIEATPEQLTGLYQALNPTTGEVTELHIEDKRVNNLQNSSGGGLQAHNYWDNQPEFIEPVAALLKELIPPS